MLTHWLQIHLHKLIPDRVRKDARWEVQGGRQETGRHKYKENGERGGESAEVVEAREKEKRASREGTNRVAETDQGGKTGAEKRQEPK